MDDEKRYRAAAAEIMRAADDFKKIVLKHNLSLEAAVAAVYEAHFGSLLDSPDVLEFCEKNSTPPYKFVKKRWLGFGFGDWVELMDIEPLWHSVAKMIDAVKSSAAEPQDKQAQ